MFFRCRFAWKYIFAECLKKGTSFLKWGDKIYLSFGNAHFSVVNISTPEISELINISIVKILTCTVQKQRSLQTLLLPQTILVLYLAGQKLNKMYFNKKMGETFFRFFYAPHGSTFWSKISPFMHICKWITCSVFSRSNPKDWKIEKL